MEANQLPIRNVAIDAVNSITRSSKGDGVAAAAVKVLGSAVRSGNNGVRMPAINAVVRAVEGSRDVAAPRAALDALATALDSNAVIGGMEVRMMAIGAVEKVGIDVADVGVKAKAMGLLQAGASRNGWEPDARKRAQDAAARIQETVQQP